MAFTQIIEVRADDESAVRDHVAGWHAEQHGIAPGYEGARILADTAEPGRYLVVVDFADAAAAAANNDRPETAAWATKLGELVDGAPAFSTYRQVCTTAGS